jgi:hypothetical protein
VHREIASIVAQNKVILRETKRAVTPYGGLSVFVEYLRKILYSKTVGAHIAGAGRPERAFSKTFLLGIFPLQKNSPVFQGSFSAIETGRRPVVCNRFRNRIEP